MNPLRPAAQGTPEGGFVERLASVWREADPGLRRRLLSIYAVLIGFNVVVWALLLVTSARYPLLLGLAPVAFGFGLRHAVDPDHIAAIDNTTRKLMQDGQRPVAVGYFFSLGHSTIVFALSVLIAISAAFVKANLPQMQNVGGVIGTTVSGVFLVVIAIINLIVLIDIYKTWRKVVQGGTYDDKTLDDYLANRGVFARLLKPVLRVVRHSWNMYVIGLLFGLGFDTASEVGILGMSGIAGSHAIPVWSVLLLPLLFVAGMSLIDTSDGIAMLGAYGWAYVRPVRKLYYNMSITLISVVIALFIGGLECLQVIIGELNLSGGVWDVIQNQMDISNWGFYIIGLFLVAWIGSIAYYKLHNIDRLDDELPRAPSPGTAGGA
jgi:high-affinity nickel-transport protein